MRRRDVLKTAAVLPLLAADALPPLWGTARTGFSRVRPSQPRWPSPQNWEKLRAAVGGNLIQPGALLAACRESAAAESCADVLKSLRNPYYIGDQPSGTQVSGWLDAWTSAPSAYAVAAHTSGDIVAAVNFAREHNLRLVVKGGGHSYQGTSNAADSLLIWTRAMNQIELHEAFVAKGCSALQSPTPAVTVEAGAMWMDVYQAVSTKGGRYVQGGGCTTVGVAGHVQSGGFGSFSKRYGTAAGSLLEADIVTADGKLRTVNPASDPELFWGLKGGGGGSLGVVAKVTLKTHELAEFAGGAGGAIHATSDESFRRLLRRFVDFYADSLFNPHWGEQVAVRRGNVLTISMVCQGLDQQTAAGTWDPFAQWINSAGSEFQVIEPVRAGALSELARNWWNVPFRSSRLPGSLKLDERAGAAPTHAWWSGDQEQVGAFLHGFESVWLPASLLAPAQRQGLADALFEASRHMDVEMHFNKGLAGAPPEVIEAARNTAMNPAVLDSCVLAIIATGGASRYPGLSGATPNDAVAHQNASAVDEATRRLLEIAPAAGSYVSESNYFNRQWSNAFWGGNYPRLQRVKRTYDPHGLFFVHHGVGSEEWSADGFTRVSG